MTDRERLIELLTDGVTRAMGIHEHRAVAFADAIISAGWTLPKPEAEDRETAEQVYDGWRRTFPKNEHARIFDLCERIAAALSAVRAQMQARVDEWRKDLDTACKMRDAAIERATAAEAALERARAFAKRMRKARDLQGPAEYRNDPKAMKIWQRALYHEGKELDEILRAALEPPPCK